MTGLAIASHLQEEEAQRGVPVSSHIHVTDQAQLLPLIQHNIALNSLLESIVSPSVLNWGENVPPHIPVAPDVILAADCVYFEHSFPLLLDTMHRLMGPETVCYFCQVKRRKADMRFMKKCEKQFAVRRCVDDERVMQQWQRQGIFM